MIYLSLLCAALIGLVIWERHQNTIREKEWSLERASLITRIQHPEFVVATPEREAISDSEYLNEEIDEIDRVGTIIDG